MRSNITRIACGVLVASVLALFPRPSSAATDVVSLEAAPDDTLQACLWIGGGDPTGFRISGSLHFGDGEGNVRLEIWDGKHLVAELGPEARPVFQDGLRGGKTYTLRLVNLSGRSVTLIISAKDFVARGERPVPHTLEKVTPGSEPCR